MHLLLKHQVKKLHAFWNSPPFFCAFRLSQYPQLLDDAAAYVYGHCALCNYFFFIVYFINLKASLKIKNIIFKNDLAKRGREITIIIQTNIMY